MPLSFYEKFTRTVRSIVTGNPRNRAGAPRGKRSWAGKRPPSERNQAIVARAIETASLTVTGKEYGLTRERVRQLCAKAGVAIRPLQKAKTAERLAAAIAARPPRLTAAERFLSYVEKTDTCWLWKGATNPYSGGWGVFHMMREGKQTNLPAQRASWILFRGEIPPEKSAAGRRIWRVSQTCCNVLCVNPDHLALLTQQQIVNKREQLRAAGAYPPRHNALKTHCKHGHEFTEQNTYRHNGGRYCRACANVRSQAYQSKPTEAVHV